MFILFPPIHFYFVKLTEVVLFIILLLYTLLIVLTRIVSTIDLE